MPKISTVQLRPFSGLWIAETSTLVTKAKKSTELGPDQLTQIQ